jgi:hypothetical protein
VPCEVATPFIQNDLKKYFCTALIAESVPEKFPVVVPATTIIPLFTSPLVEGTVGMEG